MASDLNLKTLREARTVRRLSVQEVSEFTKISESSIRKIEAGEKDPSFPQLEKLGELYNLRPLTFFEDDTPKFDATLPDFRQNSPTAANVSPRGLRRIWDVENRAKFTKTLLDALGNDVPQLASFKRLTNKRAPDPESLRENFSDWRERVSHEVKFNAASPEGFFRYLRLFIETTGCVTSVNSAPLDDYLGFFKTSGKKSNTLFVNREIKNVKRSLFTLVHELSHFLHDSEGISNPFVAKNNTERESNKFAAEFLAPSQQIASIVDKYSSFILSDSSRLINAVSGQTLLSRQAAAVRLYDLGFLTRKQTSEFFALFAKSRRESPEPPAPKREIKGRNIVIGKRLSEIGIFPAFVASLAIERKIVDFVDVERGLGVGEGIQGDLLALARKRFEASLD